MNSAQNDGECQARVLTVGQLRAVLERLEGRDDLPVQAVVAFTPGDFVEGGVRIAVGAEVDVVVTPSGPGPGHDALVILLDLPAGDG